MSESPLTCRGSRVSGRTMGSVCGSVELEDLCLDSRGGAEGKGMRLGLSGGGALVGGKWGSVGIGGGFLEGLERLLNFL